MARPKKSKVPPSIDFGACSSDDSDEEEDKDTPESLDVLEVRRHCTKHRLGAPKFTIIQSSKNMFIEIGRAHV